MFNIKERPYNLFPIASIIVLISSFPAFGTTVDIYLHDTYFIFASADLLWGITGLLLILWTVYLLTQRFLFSKVLTWIHVILTVTTLVFVAAISFYLNHYHDAVAG